MSIIMEAGLKNGMIVSDGSKFSKNSRIATSAELATKYGYLVNPELLKGVDLEALLSTAHILTGSNREYVPMYPGFPRQVKELSSLTLVVDQLVHYISAGELVPNLPHEKREELNLLEVFDNATTIDKVVDKDDFVKDTLYSLAHKKQGMNDFELKLVESFVPLVNTDFVVDAIVTSTHGENANHVLNAIADSLENEDIINVFNSAKNSDHLLRFILTIYGKKNTKSAMNYPLAVDHLSNDNAKAVHLKSIPRSVRKAIVNKLSMLAPDTREFSADRIFGKNLLWQRVMISVHPYSMSLDSNQKRVCDIIHGNIEYKTFNSELEEVLKGNDVSKALKLLKNNHGMLLRKINHLITMNPRSMRTINAHINKIDNVRLSTVISAYNGVLNYNEDKVTRVSGYNNVVRSNDREYVNVTNVLKALEKLIYRCMEKLDVSHIDTINVGSGDFGLPLIVRDTSDTKSTIYRGENIMSFEDSDTIRVFTHWYNANRRTDVDASVLFVDNDYNKVSIISWNHNDRSFGTYSGDLTNAPKPHGAAEFIDFEVNNVKKKGVSYAVFKLHVYSGIPFDSIDHIAGTMVRKDADKGEIFDPRTVATSFSSSLSTTSITPLIIDLNNNVVKWIDSSSGSLLSGNSTLDNTENIKSLINAEMSARLTTEKFATMLAKTHNIPINKNAKVDVELLTSLLD